MDLTVRTAHGSADISVDLDAPAAESSTLRDLVVAVSGQAAPPAALVDGRTVDSETALRRCGLMHGSLVDTDLARSPVAPPPGATLLQLTGPGAGEIRPLPVGIHRVGPGRRTHARELDAAPVETPVFEIDVRSAAVSVVSPSPTAGDEVTVDGRPLVGAVEWSGGRLSAHGRTFALEGPSPARPRPDAAAVDGTILFNRPPTSGDDADRLPTADAVRDALWRRPTLWRRRLGEDASCVVDLGIVPHTGSVASIDLAADRTLAIVGDATTRRAHARAVIVDAVTTHGPSDLAVAIATTEERLGEWDWAKWLPHVRTGERPDLLCSIPDLDDLDARLPLARARRTLVVVTADELWNGPDSPLRGLVLDQAPRTSLLVLTESEHSAPASCQSFVEHVDDLGRARLVRLSRGRAQLALSVPLMEVGTAETVARGLAPLRDPDLHLDRVGRPAGPTTLAALVADGDTRHPRHGAASARWTRDGDRDASMPLPIGTNDGAPVHIDLGASRGVVVSGSTLDEAVDIVRTLALAMATSWAPTELSIVIVDHRADEHPDPLVGLPHHAGTFSARGAAAARAMVARLRHHLTTSTGMRIAVIVRGAAHTRLAAPGALAGLIGVADELPGCHVLIATDTPLAALDRTVRGAGSYEVSVDHVGGRRRGTLTDTETGRRQAFVPFETPTDLDGGLLVRPFVFGRPPTTLERRLARRGPGGVDHHGGSRAIDAIVEGLREFASERGDTTATSLVPVELPDAVDATELLRRFPGDGIPIGLVERPEHGSPGPYWWSPGADGSLLAIGSPRSGTRVVTDLLVLGCADRFAAEDLAVYVIDPSQTRRSQFERLPNVHGTCAPDRGDDVNALLAPLVGRLDGDDRAGGPDGAGAAALVIVREVERLLPDGRAALARLAGDGAGTGINVVATATRRGDVEDLFGQFARLLAGDPAEVGDLDGLGLDDVDDVLRRPGRCVALPERRLVQLGALSVAPRQGDEARR